MKTSNVQAVKDVENESKQLQKQVEKLGKILEAYQSESLAGGHLVEDCLDGLNRYVILHPYH